MAQHIMWFQGAAEFRIPNCDGKPTFKCPESKRTAAEYMRGYFTLTNVMNPNVEYDNLGYETWLYKHLSEVKVGDYLWLVLVPPKHHVYDVFAFNETTLTEASSLASMADISLDLVTGQFKAADAEGKCDMTNEATYGTLAFPAGVDAKEQFLRAAVDVTNDVETWTGVGFKVSALPNNRTLADIIGRIAIGAHVLDYEAQVFM